MTALPQPTLAHHTDPEWLRVATTAHLLPKPSHNCEEVGLELTWSHENLPKQPQPRPRRSGAVNN